MGRERQGPRRADRAQRRAKLSLADKNGKTRAQLTVKNDGPELTLWDEDSKLRNVLMVDENGPSLNLFDENGVKIWSQP